MCQLHNTRNGQPSIICKESVAGSDTHRPASLWGPEGPFLRLKLQVQEAGHSSPSNSDVTNEWSCTSTLQFLVDYVGKPLLYSTFLLFFCIVTVMYSLMAKFLHKGS